MRKRLLIPLLLFCPLIMQAQEVFINADLVSSYMWRGMKCGNASVQPTLGVTWSGFTLSAWGSTEFRTENNEIVLNLEYAYKGLSLQLNNVFTQCEDEPFDYFNYSSHSTGHTFELGVAYTFGDKFPLSASWYTIFTGNDYRESGNRAWSTYCELSYPFSVKSIDMTLEVGLTPWDGMYADRFNVNNVALTASKEIQLAKRFALPLFGKLGFNPYESTAYFVVGITL